MEADVRIVLLRGINVGGHRRLPMADLRALCEAVGLRNARTYIQSGNVVVHSSDSPSTIEHALEEAIEREFGFSTSVLCRTLTDWARYVASNPFPDPSESEPNRVMLGLAKETLAEDVTDVLAAHAVANERIIRSDDAVWIHFPDGAGSSKISPAVLDRAAGSPLTMRNWRTVLKLKELAESGLS